MKSVSSLVLSSVVTLAAATSVLAQGHSHMTVDTFATKRGSQCLIRAGYYPTEAQFSIANGRLFYNGEIAVYQVPDQFNFGQFFGWYGGVDLLLTSDFYFGTGRLSGGNFLWELFSIVPISGGACTVVWGEFDFDFTATARSDAASRVGRSFDTMVAGHNHDQGYAFSVPGLYDVTFIVWDSNGLYLDSEPVTVRFQVGPPLPPCTADFNHDGTVNSQDFFDFLTAFFASLPPADFNHDGNINSQDFFDFLTAFFAGC